MLTFLDNLVNYWKRVPKSKSHNGSIMLELNRCVGLCLQDSSTMFKPQFHINCAIHAFFCVLIFIFVFRTVIHRQQFTLLIFIKAVCNPQGEIFLCICFFFFSSCSIRASKVQACDIFLKGLKMHVGLWHSFSTIRTCHFPSIFPT